MWPFLILLLVAVDARNLEAICPSLCTCNYFITDCKYKGFTNLPENIPDDVVSLDLAFNNLKNIPLEINNFSQLKYLNLSHNQITIITNSNFQNLLELEHLDLSHNSIYDWKNIQYASFSNNKNLKYLHLSHNPLGSLTYASSPLKIESLLTLKLINCSITNLQSSALNKLVNLRELYLSDNFISYLGESLPLPKLLYADFSRNHIVNVSKNSFSLSRNLDTLILSGNTFLKRVFLHADSLVYLDLSNCTLEIIPLGRLANVTYLNLSNNFLKIIKNREFINLKSLQIVDLSINSISSIEENAFYRLENLKTLDISYNKITDFSNKTFETTPNLIKLNISHNYLRTLDNIMTISLKQLDASFCEIYSLNKQPLFGMPSLVTLNLSRNFISTLPDRLYSESLVYLDVSWCRIRSLTNETFEAMEHLQRINLAGNLLTTLDPSFFPRITWINIAHNQWRCDCFKLKKMYDWLFSSGYPDQYLICDSPESLEGKTWKDACSSSWTEEEEQKDSLWWYSVGVVICMVLLLLGVVIVRRIHKLKEKRLQQIEENRRAEEREALRRMQRIQREYLEQDSRNAPDPRELQRPPSYNEAMLLPRIDASTQSLQSIGSRGSNSEKGGRRKRKRRKKPDSRRSSRVVVDDSSDEEREERPALESDF